MLEVFVEIEEEVVHDVAGVERLVLGEIAGRASGALEGRAPFLVVASPVRGSSAMR